MKITLVTYNDKEDRAWACPCVGKHIPLPHKLYQVEHDSGTVFVCPTAYLNVVSLEEEYQFHGGNPPGSVRKHYSDFIHELHSLLYCNKEVVH